MYYLNKIVAWCLSPMGLLFLGLGVAWLLRRWRALSRILSGLTLLLVWFFGCGVMTRFIGVPLEGAERQELPPYAGQNAIVLLGGGMGAHEQCGRAEMFSGADRVWTAARLWKFASSLPIICSGGGVEKSTVPLLVDLGVPRESILTLPQPRNTEEEARMIAEILQSRNIESSKVFLVTSAWHMPRAQMLFERAGLAVTPVPTDYEMHCAAEASLSINDFSPGAEALMRNSYAVKEWVARFFYWLKG